MTHRPKAPLRTLSLALAGLLAVEATAQKTPPKKPDPTLKETLEKLEDMCLDRKNPRDAEARKLIDELLSRYDAMHPRDQAAFARSVAQPLVDRRCVREATDDGLFRAVITALGRTGKHGSRYLWQAFDDKSEGRKFKGKEWLNLRSEMVEHLGRTKDEKFADELVEAALRSNEETLMARAGGALRHFEDSPHKLRHEVVKKLHKKFAEIYNNANSYGSSDKPGGGAMDQQRNQTILTAVSDPWNVTLQKLTRQPNINTTEGWTHFWAKHKGDRTWDQKTKSSKGKRTKTSNRRR